MYIFTLDFPSDKIHIIQNHSITIKYRKAMATDSVISKLKPAEVQEIVTAFKEFDANDNGSITPQEMKECLRKSKIPFQDAEVEEVIKSMDNNQDGTVSFEEYMEFMAYAFSGQIKKYTPKTKDGSKTRTTKK